MSNFISIDGKLKMNSFSLEFQLVALIKHQGDGDGDINIGQMNSYRENNIKKIKL